MASRRFGSMYGADKDSALPADSKPIVLAEKLEIARKPKNINGITAETNMATQPINGSSKRKRSIGEVDVDGVDTIKRPKVHVPHTAGDVVILVDDRSNGAIVIDDD